MGPHGSGIRLIYKMDFCAVGLMLSHYAASKFFVSETERGLKTLVGAVVFKIAAKIAPLQCSHGAGACIADSTEHYFTSSETEC